MSERTRRLVVGFNWTARQIGVSPAALSSWRGDEPGLFERAEGGKVFLTGRLGVFITLTASLTAARARWPAIRSLWKVCEGALEAARQRGHHAFLLGNLANGRAIAVTSPIGADPKPPTPENVAIPLSKLEATWTAAIDAAIATLDAGEAVDVAGMVEANRIALVPA